MGGGAVSAVTRETTVQLHGAADQVVETFDNWEGMGLLRVRFGAHDGTGKIAWSEGDHVVDREMARALASVLLAYADSEVEA